MRKIRTFENKFWAVKFHQPETYCDLCSYYRNPMKISVVLPWKSFGFCVIIPNFSYGASVMKKLRGEHEINIVTTV